ncbi:MAG: heavy metal-binding domain-containing protein [bacterium]
MKKIKYFGIGLVTSLMLLALIIFVAKPTFWGSNNHQMDNMEQNHTQNNNHKMQNNQQSQNNNMMESSIIREGVIDLSVIDENKDGKVFQDSMDWNVISDKPGKCPVCKMLLVEFSLKDAKSNLEKNGYKTK